MSDQLTSVAPARPAPPAVSRRPAIIAAAIMGAICLVYLWFPGDGDQTLFELGARRLLLGEHLYRDFWDIKQPGIYWFFELGTAFGPGVLGPRLLELAGVALGGWLVWHVTGSWRLQTAVRVVSPALVIGSYVLLAHRDGVTQIEGLMNPWVVAIFVLTWPADPSGGEPRPVRRWVLAGLICGVVGVFKLVYLPIPVVLLLGAAAAVRGSSRVRLGRIGAAAAGALVPLLAMVLFFAVQGDLSLLRVTTLLPLEAIDQVPLADGWHRWKDLIIHPIVPLAVLAVLSARRRGTVIREATLVLTAITAYALSTPQYPGPYRLLMLAAPCGLLAVTGADVLWRWAGTPAGPRELRRTGVLVLAALLCAPMAWGPWRLLSHAGQIPWGLGQNARNARDFVLLNEPHDLEFAPVRSLIRPGTAMYVFGHPQLYELAAGYQAVPISGWDPDGMPRRVWTERDRELVITRPQWVYIETRFIPLVQRSSPRFSQLLHTSYTVVSRTEAGTWFRTGDVGTPVTNLLDQQKA